MYILTVHDDNADPDYSLYLDKDEALADAYASIRECAANYRDLEPEEFECTDMLGHDGWWFHATTLCGSINISVRSIRPATGVPSDAICVFKDGNKYCAVRGDFKNLQVSPAAFAPSIWGAIQKFFEENS